jgi:hypothetical protein
VGGGLNKYHVKFSLNSTNKLNYKDTSEEFIAGESTPKKKKKEFPINALYQEKFK